MVTTYSLSYLTFFCDNYMFLLDAGGGKHSVSPTENGIKQASGAAVSNSLVPAVKEVKIKETASAR